RTLQADVAVLPGCLHGELPHEANPAVAGAHVAAGRAGRNRGAALTAPVLSRGIGHGAPAAGSAGAGSDVPRRSGGRRLRQSCCVVPAGGAPSSTVPSRPRLTSSGRMSGSLPEKSVNSCSASLLPPCESRVARKRSPFSRVRPPFSSIQATVLASSTSDQI